MPFVPRVISLPQPTSPRGERGEQARTAEHAPACKDWHAMSTATRLLEQAVSMWTLGPFRSKYQLTRFEMRDDAAPVAAVRSTFSGSCESILDQSSVNDAANTAVLEPLSFSAGIPARKPLGLADYDGSTWCWEVGRLTIFESVVC